MTVALIVCLIVIAALVAYLVLQNKAKAFAQAELAKAKAVLASATGGKVG